MKGHFGAIFLGLLGPLPTLGWILHGGPLGVTLCKWICCTTFRCDSFTYLPRSFTCRKDKFTNTLEELIYEEIKDVWLPNGISNSTCPDWSRIIFTRSKKPVCVYTRDEPGGQLKEHGEELETPYKLKYYPKYLYFLDAKKHCRKEGGSLAQFRRGFNNDRFRYAHLGNIYTSKCAWIDLTYSKDLSEYTWGDGTPYLDDTKWVPGEALRSGLGFEKNCVCVAPSGLLMTTSRYRMFHFLCEMPMKELTAH